MPDSVQNYLQELWSNSAERSYQASCIRLNRVLLVKEVGFETLMTACSDDKTPGIPSWCMEFGSQLDYSPYDKRDGTIFQSYHVGEISSLSGILLNTANSDDNYQHRLQSYGFCYLKGVLNSRYRHCHDLIPHPECAASWLVWLEDCVDFAMSHNVNGKELTRALLGTGEYDEADVFENIKNISKYWKNLRDGTVVEDEKLVDAEHLERRHQLINTLSFANLGRRLIFTSRSTLCLGHHSAQVGDQVCLFKDAPVPFILRRIITAGTVWTLISDAWMEGVPETAATVRSNNLVEQTFVLE